MNIKISFTPTDLASILLPYVRQRLGNDELTTTSLLVMSDGTTQAIDYLLFNVRLSGETEDDDPGSGKPQETLQKLRERHGTGERTETLSPKDQAKVEPKLVVGGIYSINVQGCLPDFPGFECLEVAEQSGRTGIDCWIVNEKGDRCPEFVDTVTASRSEFGERIF